jgi:Outer membrane protein beta-barrel domain
MIKGLYMKTAVVCLAVISLTFCFLTGESLGELKYGDFRLGAHGVYINPQDSDFEHLFGYGAIAKYKFTETLGIEAGVDYFRWELDAGDVDMPFSTATGPVTYKEVDRVYPIYFTAQIFAPITEQSARGYLGLGAGYYEIDSDIEGNYDVVVDGVTYPFAITGKVTGQWSVHAAIGADFQLSTHIYLNVEARYVMTDIDREQTHSNPTKGSVTVKDETELNNWQIRMGLEYSF